MKILVPWSWLKHQSCHVKQLSGMKKFRLSMVEYFDTAMSIHVRLPKDLAWKCLIRHYQNCLCEAVLQKHCPAIKFLINLCRYCLYRWKLQESILQWLFALMASSMSDSIMGINFFLNIWNNQFDSVMDCVGDVLCSVTW